MQKGKPDMCVLDVLLTDGNGIEVCESLKSNQKTNHVPVLMMSANAKLYNVKKNCNAEDFISKPFDIDDFVKRIDHYMH